MGEAFITRRGGSAKVELKSIEVTTPPTKTTYIAGESFNSADMVVMVDIGGVDIEASGYTVSPTVMVAGVTSVTVSYTNGGITKTANQSVTVITPSATLENNSWETIGLVADAGMASQYWSVGATKTITVNGTVGTITVNGDYNTYILGFNHNATYEGSNRIHFGCFKTTGGVDVCLIDGVYADFSNNVGGFTMNPASEESTSTNAGGWAGCKMRTVVLGSDSLPTSPTANTLLAAFPADLRAVMKSATKYTDNTSGTSNAAANVTASTDYLPLLAEFEIFGVWDYANSAEQNYQAQYAYFIAGNSKVKYKYTSTGTTALWWERSLFSGDSVAFCFVDTGGSANAYGSGASFGVAPGFFV